MPEGVYMTQKEIERVEIFSRVKEKRLNQRQAAEKLGISLRQVQRLYKLYQEKGAFALASKKRGKRSNNKITENVMLQISEIITKNRYRGFGPTLMNEKLEELHGICISRETTRQLMVSNKVWVAKREKRPVIHQQRQRRARNGELVQIDGSPHAWFEDRGKPCNLLVFIDDATGRTYGKFFETETTAAYMETMQEYIAQYGAPLAVYSDKHSVFRINHGQGIKKDNYTQFGRALKELDIELIYANSPQAKGRVERANKTLQDRLIKELRLAGVSTIYEANQFLGGFWKKHNEKFCVAAVNTENAHRAIKEEIDLKRILCRKEQRVISKNHEFQFDNVIYQVVVDKPYMRMAGMKVTVVQGLDGSLSFEHKDKPLIVKRYDEQVFSGIELSSKELDDHFRRRSTHRIPKHHPWLQAGRAEIRMRKYKAA